MTIDWNSFALGAGAGVLGIVIVLGLFYIAKKKKKQNNQGNNRIAGRGYPQQPFQRKQRGMQKPFLKRRQMQPIQRQPQYVEPVEEPYYDDQQLEEPLYDDQEYVEQPQEIQYQEPYQDEYAEDNFGDR
jgi:hypothetical protein